MPAGRLVRLVAASRQPTCVDLSDGWVLFFGNTLKHLSLRVILNFVRCEPEILKHLQYIDWMECVVRSQGSRKTSVYTIIVSTLN